MLYQFLMDDVVRKPPKIATTTEEELEHSPTGTLMSSKSKSAGLSRARSAPKKQKKMADYPMRKLRQDSVDDDSAPNSPRAPESAVTRIGKGAMRRGESRLTM
jgi:hypothetical protein